MSLFDSASLVVTPNGYKEDKLYSIKPTDGSGDLVVTRATTATRVNSDGLIEQVPYNLLSYSEQFDNAYWTKEKGGVALVPVVTPNVETAPNGTTTADRIVFSLNGGTSSSDISQLASGLFSSVSLTRTQSVYIKTTDGSTKVFSFVSPTGVATSITVTPSYQRFTYTTTGINAGTIRLRLRGAGEGTSTTASIAIWGAQYVEGTSAKEYFPTTDRLDVPRLDYTNSTCPSILVEPQRTNLITYSEQLDNAAWVKTAINITANSTTSPDGTTTADKFIPTSATSLHIAESSSVSFVSGTTYTFSFYGKKAENNFIQFTASSALLGIRANFDLNSGVLGTVDSGITATITSIGNDGWYRCTATFTASVTGSYRIVLTAITNSTASRFQPFAGNNVNGLFIWGAQLEAGSYATSYIPTQASSVTRNADVISKTGISSLIGQTEGTLFFDGVVNNIQNVFSNILNTNKSLSLSTIQLSKRKSDNKFRFDQFLGNGTTSSIVLNSTNAFANGTRTKIAIRYKSGSFAMYINGNLEATSSDSFTNIGTKTELFLNDAVTFFNYQESVSFNSVVLFTSGLTNDELAQLTTI